MSPEKRLNLRIFWTQKWELMELFFQNKLFQYIHFNKKEPFLKIFSLKRVVFRVKHTYFVSILRYFYLKSLPEMTENTPAFGKNKPAFTQKALEIWWKVPFSLLFYPVFSFLSSANNQDISLFVTKNRDFAYTHIFIYQLINFIDRYLRR